MLKRKLFLLITLVSMVLLLFFMQSYVSNEKRKNLNEHFVLIYKVQKDLGWMRMLVSEAQGHPASLERIQEQWGRLVLRIRVNAARIDADTALDPNAYSGVRGYVKTTLDEVNDNFKLLAGLAAESVEPSSLISLNFMSTKVYAGITHLSSLLERRADMVTTELTKQKQINERWLLVLMIANLGIMLAIAFKVETWLIKPISELLTSIERFGSGDWSVRSSVTRRDEVGLLARGFDRMADQIVTLFDTEKALRVELQTQHEKLVEANRLAQIGHWYWDVDTGEFSWSDEIYQILEQDRVVSDYQSEGDSPFPQSLWLIIKEKMAQCRRTGSAFSIEPIKCSLNAKEKYLVIRGGAIKADGRVCALYGTVQDITEFKLLNDALAVSEEKYRLALSATRDGIWDWDVKSNKVDLSADWSGLLANIENFDDWRKRVHPDDIEDVLESLNDHLGEKRGVWQAECRIKADDKEWVWVLARGEIVTRDDNGAPRRMVGTISNIQSKKEQENLIWRQANFDALTLLPNRKLLTEHVTKRLAEASRSQESVWLLFLDLDGFKEVNDNMGHDVGDQLLIQVAERLKQALRQADIVVRLGGDEFVVVLSRVRSKQAVEKVADHIITMLSDKYNILGNEVHVTTSIGIANYPRDANNLKELLQYADQSMYAAKNSGKNRFRYFTRAMQEESQYRVRLARRMREALAEEQFELYYQPIVALADGKIHKAEALIRWRPEGREFLAPDAFIPIAEETGLIVEAGRWVLNEATRQLSEWMSYDENFQLSINMSPVQIKRPDFMLDDWLDMVADSQVSRESLLVEITENTLLNHCDDSVNNKLIQFRNQGIQVAIDDFGTGYSSLSYLHKFEIDFLKIDRSFVSQLGSAPSAEAICKAIITMAHSLGMKVIAEGVETQYQSSVLRRLGCDYGQGFYYAHPLPPQEFSSVVFESVAV